MFDERRVVGTYRRSDLCDDRQFVVGEVYYIKDKLVSIPTIDRTDKPRKVRIGRRVVIACNNYLNTDPTWPLVYIAPLCSRIDLMAVTDILVTTAGEDGNAVKKDCKIELGLVQPILKVDLERKVGSLSRSKIAEMLVLLQDMISGNLNPLEHDE